MEPIHTWMLPVFDDERGALSVIEHKDLPFMPVRSYFLYHAKQKRGGHAHLKEKEVFVCIAGSFTATVHDGKTEQKIVMDKPGMALYTDALIWHEFDDFSSDALMLALSSTPYEGTKEYIMSLDQFISMKNK